MTSAALLIILGQQAAGPMPFPVELMRGAAYQITYEPKAFEKFGSDPFEAAMSFKRPDDSSLFIRIFWTKDVGQAKYLPFPLGSEDCENFRRMRFNGQHQGKETPSGLPPKYAGYTIAKEFVSLHIDSIWASVECQWATYQVPNGTPYPDFAPFNTVAKSAFVEKVARHSLSRAVGLRLDPVETNNTTPAAKCRLTQAKFSDLSKWAELNGWKIGDENDYGIITLKKGDVEAVLPLGADQIKVKGAWKEMGDSAAFFNGKLYLPESGLKHLQAAYPSPP